MVAVGEIAWALIRGTLYAVCFMIVMLLFGLVLSPWGIRVVGSSNARIAGNIVRNNLAHSFSFKADSSVKAENNQEVTAAEFDQKLAALVALIDGKFGAIAPAAVDRIGERDTLGITGVPGVLGLAHFLDRGLARERRQRRALRFTHGVVS